MKITYLQDFVRKNSCFLDVRHLNDFTKYFDFELFFAAVCNFVVLSFHEKLSSNFKRNRQFHGIFSKKTSLATMWKNEKFTITKNHFVNSTF